MICKHCNEPMKEYVGFNMASSGEYDCVNKNCTPETTEAHPEVSNGRCNGALYYYKSINAWRCRSCLSEFTSAYLDDEGFDECPIIIPTQSEPDQSSATLAANSASSRIPHKSQFQRVADAFATGDPSRCVQALSPDDPDQCTLQQQGSDLPPKLGTPMPQYGTGWARQSGKTLLQAQWLREYLGKWQE